MKKKKNDDINPKRFEKHKSETIEQKILRQMKEGKKANPLPDIIGKWPGEESYEELQKMLRKLD